MLAHSKTNESENQINIDKKLDDLINEYSSSDYDNKQAFIDIALILKGEYKDKNGQILFFSFDKSKKIKEICQSINRKKPISAVSPLIEIVRRSDMPEEIKSELCQTLDSISYSESYWEINYKEAKKQLAAVPKDKRFVFHGKIKPIDSLESLLKTFKKVNNASFEYHITSEKDDFIKWIDEVTGCTSFAKRLKQIPYSNRTKENYTALLEEYITILKKRTNLPKIISQLIKYQKNNSPSEFFIPVLIEAP